uniref:Uncharacterized protein n=1 Tax=Arundo donax TaxID=35708 RepID=A0A0A9H253_ARUDO
MLSDRLNQVNAGSFINQKNSMRAVSFVGFLKRGKEQEQNTPGEYSLYLLILENTKELDLNL